MLNSYESCTGSAFIASIVMANQYYPGHIVMSIMENQGILDLDMAMFIN